MRTIRLRGPVVPLIPLLILFGLQAGCPGTQADPEQLAKAPVTLTPDQIAVVLERQLSTGPGLSGTLAAGRKATLRAEIGGAVVEMRVEAGQAVTSGELLARIDDRVWQDQVFSARTAVRLADEALDLARRNRDRAIRLAEAGAIAERELETARIGLTNAEAAAAEAQARLASATQQLARTFIRAPFRGVVSERDAQGGDVLQVGNPIVTLVDARELRLEAAVPVSALPALTIGMPVDFDIAGIPDRRFAGQVDRINPTVDPATRQIRVHVTIPNPDGNLVAGLFAQGRVTTEQSILPAVPEEAIDYTGPAPTVRRVALGVVERVAVVPGLRDEVLGWIAIGSGLAPGDTVLIGSAQTLAVGTPVRLRKE